MTAIRPRPTPEQERRAQARAQAQSTAKDQNLVPQSRFPLVLAVFYIALLVVPWALMCKIATDPSFIVALDSRGYDYYVQHGWVIAIDVLNSLATVLSLPILSALLARAAVVFSQRRRPGQALSVRQLFALADRDWYNLLNVLSPVRSSALLRLGSLLLFIAILLPPIRSGLVTYDYVPISLHWPGWYGRITDLIGTTPSPTALKSADGVQTPITSATRKSLRLASGGIEPNLWPVCNDPEPGSTCGFSYGPYDMEQSRLSNFWESLSRYYSGEEDSEANSSALMHASTMRVGSSIGTYKGNRLGAYALGLKSGTRCETVSEREVEEQCIRSTDNGALPAGARGWNTSLDIPQEIRLNVCYPPLETDPWESADASPWRPIRVTEHLYVGLDDPDSYDWGCSQYAGGSCEYLGSSSGLHIHCQAESMMSYFELGKASTRGKPGPLLEEMPAGFEILRPDEPPKQRATDSYVGPLKTATMAMFGDDSWFDLLKAAMADVEGSNLTIAAAITMLCSARPLGNIEEFNSNSACLNYGYPSADSSSPPAYVFSNFVRSMLRQFQTGARARALLNTATFYANNALMFALNDRINEYSERENKFGTEESDERMYVPVLSLAAIVTVSILIGLQAVGIAILLVYVYSGSVWTWTLDAVAVARIGAQLSALDVFLVPRETGTLGPAWLTGRAAKQLEQVDGLIGSTSVTGQLTGHHDIEMATMPPPYAPRGEEPSTREERRLTQPGVAAATRETAASDHLAPAYTPSTEDHTTRAPSGEAEVAGGRGGSSEMAVSRALSSESQRAALPPSIEAVAVGGRGLIPRRRGWRKSDKPLPPPPAE